VLGDKLRHEMFLSCVRVQLSSQEYCVARSGVSVWINAGVVESLGRWKQRRGVTGLRNNKKRFKHRVATRGPSLQDRMRVWAPTLTE
jgi:hypothetical protein